MNILEKLELMIQEASGEEDPETTRDDSGEPPRASRWSKDGTDVAPPPKTRSADDPTKGHKRHFPSDMSGPKPADNPITGQIAPALAGERAKAQMTVDRVKNFIEKYSALAIDRFGGAKSATLTKGSAPETRSGARGGIHSHEQLMSKERAVKLIDQLPMMPSSQAQLAVRALGTYIWKIHANAREQLRTQVKGDLTKQGALKKPEDAAPKLALDRSHAEFKDAIANLTSKGIARYENEKLLFKKSHPLFKTAMTDLVTRGIITQKGGASEEPHPSYEPALKAASRDFEIDSIQIKADLNLLASATGQLRKSTGGGGKADATYLAKKLKWRGEDQETGEQMPPSVEIVPKAPSVSLPPELRQMAGDWTDDSEKSSKKTGSGGGGRKRVPTTGNKLPGRPLEIPKSMQSVDVSQLPDELPDDWIKDSFNRYLDLVIEQAVADRDPQWWDAAE
jgi:hypothetical protein